MSQCVNHSQHKIKCLCIDKSCHSRLACEDCIDQLHLGHSVIMIKKGIKEFVNLYKNSDKPNAQNNKNTLAQYYSELKQEASQINEILNQWKQNLNINLLGNFKALSNTFSLEYFDQVWETLQIPQNDYSKFCFVKKEHPYRQQEQVEDIARNMRFLNNELFDDPPKIMNTASIIHKEIRMGLKQCKRSIERALQKFKIIAQEYNFCNFQQIHLKKQKQNLLNLTPSQKIYEFSPVHQCKNQVKKRRKRSINKEILEKQKSIEKYSVLTKRDDEIVWSSKLGKQIPTEEIKIFLKEQPVSTRVQHFQINGLNRFDESCLEILCQKFPNLKKLYYTFNYDDNGISTSREQVFNTKIYQISDCLVEASPSTLHLFSKLPQLENLLIGEKSLSLKAFTIRNKKLKHLTIGQNHKKKKNPLPTPLIQEIITSNFLLLTLNIFNIFSIPSTFLNKIFQAYKGLKQLWISASSYYQGDLFKNLKNSRLNTLILDQIKINHPLHVPKTLENLIIDNCTLYHDIQGIEECKRGFKNFSLFECEYGKEGANDGDKIMNELSITSKQTIEYLNLGANPCLSGKFLSVLGEMTKLRYLCLNKAKIDLNLIGLSKLQNLKQLQMLDISGINIESHLIIQDMSKQFSQIRYLRMDCISSLSPDTFKGYKNLQKLILQGKSNLQTKELQQKLKIQKIEVQIIDR